MYRVLMRLSALFYFYYKGGKAMTNTSILAAFERMWQHITHALSGKANVVHTHDVSEIEGLESQSNVTIVRWE
jgi:hypothetical protein